MRDGAEQDCAYGGKVTPAFREYLRLVWSRWYAAIGGAALGAVGAVREIAPNLLPQQLPSWLYWIAAAGALGYAQWAAFFSIWSDRAAKTASTPDMSLSAALEYILGADALRKTDLLTDASSLLNDIRQLCHLGELSAWGRRGAAPGRETSYVLSPIPAEHWLEWHIDMIGFMKRIGQTEFQGASRSDFAANDQRYLDLHFSRAQVQRRWPREKPKLHWQKPWVRRTETGNSRHAG